MHGRPARVPSPWIDRKISVIVNMPLTASARSFAAPAPLNQKDRSNNHNRRANKTEWLQGKPEPMKHEEVAQPHGDGRNNHDEE
jgi:hypothetical protein